uniref:Conjugal transfer protein TraB n=1 Tax=Caldimicrobium thiodismutans TaxID=1653476 RepID=A0A832GNS3_9BACT
MGQDRIIPLDKKVSSQAHEAISPVEETILRTTKEIVIKFIEMGRCSPATFEEVFTLVHSVIKKTLQK